MDKSEWSEIQEGEIEYHLGKDKDRILDFNIPYWNSLLSKVNPHVTITDDTRILEVGCGCCGVLMALDTGMLTGLDSLMDQYLAHFDFLHDARPKWVCSAAENMDFPEPFDIIFNINSLDHMFDPQKAAQKFDQHLVPGGTLVISLNCHNTDFFWKYYSRFYRQVDSHHPFHFRPKDVLEMFPEYELIEVEDIDELYFPHMKQYQEKVLQQKGTVWNKVFVSMFNPFKYAVAVAVLALGWQVHRKKPKGKAIFSTYLFVLKKPK